METLGLNRKYRVNIKAGGIIILLAFVILACTPNKPEEIKALTNSEELPSLTIKELTTVITDSGKIKYRFVSPQLLQFDQKAEPTIEFPGGLHLFIFDVNEDVDAQIKCKEAVYYQNTEIWELRQDVEAINMKGEVINSELLLWDQKKRSVYSDQFIKITTQREIITGYGFESDERLENYKIKNISGILEIEDNLSPAKNN